MDKVRIDELKRANDNAQYLADMARIDQIIANGSYLDKSDLFDQDDLASLWGKSHPTRREQICFFGKNMK